jgi:predicted phage baseplate assembly protein
VVNRQTGEILFGDGRNGLVPPPGVRNVRMSLYRTGGGEAGNVVAGAIKTPLSGGRHIEKVTNLMPAQGGAESETMSALLERAPRALRHRHRAVTCEDYEDLAKLASPAVARALCVSLIDLDREPSAIIASLAQEAAGSGKVSVIIVPRSTAVRPLPSQVLISQVAAHLRASNCATTTLSVVGPLYLGVDIEARIKLQSLAFDDRVKRELQALFAAYLHPLTGRYGHGWPFGRRPQNSDIHRLIGTVTGIDHVISLKITLSADTRPFDCDLNMGAVECIERTGRFLVHSGQHRILTS